MEITLENLKRRVELLRLLKLEPVEIVLNRRDSIEVCYSPGLQSQNGKLEIDGIPMRYDDYISKSQIIIDLHPPE